jgi:hypothetical protein
MRFLRIGRSIFNPALAPHLTGLEETITLTGDAARTFRRWLDRQDVVDWTDKHRGRGASDRFPSPRGQETFDS